MDDDRDLCALLRTALERDGHTVRLLHSGAEVTEQHCAWADCILLDVMMPGEDGFATCRRIRALAGCPILFLTARTAEGRHPARAGPGAATITWPSLSASPSCGPASTPICGGRTAPPARRILRGGVTFDLAAGEAFAGETPLRLTRAEYAICEHLALHAGRTFSKEQIYEAVFGFEGTADDSAVTEHVKNIRAKLRAHGLQPIETVWGIGYRWKKKRVKHRTRTLGGLLGRLPAAHRAGLRGGGRGYGSRWCWC